MSAVGFDPSTYNSTTTSGFTVGAVYDYNGALYRFVKNSGAGALANGDVTEPTTTLGFFCQAGDAASIGRAANGAAVGVITAGNYGFVMVDGRHTAIKDAANGVTAARPVISFGGTTLGNARNAAGAATDVVFGHAITSGALGICTVDVRCV